MEGTRRTVDIGIDPFIYFVDLRAEVRWVKIQTCLLGRDHVIKSCVEYANNFRALVVDNSLCFLVPKNGEREPEENICQCLAPEMLVRVNLHEPNLPP